MGTCRPYPVAAWHIRSAIWAVRRTWREEPVVEQSQIQTNILLRALGDVRLPLFEPLFPMSWRDIGRHTGDPGRWTAGCENRRPRRSSGSTSVPSIANSAGARAARHPY